MCLRAYLKPYGYIYNFSTTIQYLRVCSIARTSRISQFSVIFTKEAGLVKNQFCVFLKNGSKGYQMLLPDKNVNKVLLTLARVITFWSFFSFPCSELTGKAFERQCPRETLPICYQNGPSLLFWLLGSSYLSILT